MTESIEWPAELTVLEKSAALQKFNDNRVALLASQGIQIQPLTWLGPRLMLLCDELIGTADTEARAAFELKLQQGYKQTIDKIESQVRQSQLTGNMTQGQQQARGGLILP